MSLPPFQRLVDAHWRDVARLAHALAGPLDGEDVAQQAWTQALAAYPALTSTAHLRAWILTITARCAMDAHRGRSRRAVPAGDLPSLADHADRAPDPADELPDAALWAHVQQLPPRQRTALVLRYVADLEHADIARSLGTTPGATRRLVSDALATIRAAMKPPGKNEITAKETP